MNKTIQVKTSDGKYKTYYKEFKNEGHFENWLAFIESRGIKVIGILN